MTEMNTVIERLDELFDELVPDVGKADTVAGEIVRAYARIRCRYYNDGDHIGIGYGRETCNAPARYLSNICGGDVQMIVLDAWDVVNDDVYECAVARLGIAVLAFLDNNPELAETANTTDMYDCAVAGVDNCDEEEAR